MEVAYAIGFAHPVSVLVETFGTTKISEEKIAELMKAHFDRPDLDLPWEKTDKAEALRTASGLKGAPERELTTV